MRTRLQSRRTDERGQALIMVLVITLVFMAAVLVALTSAVAGLSSSSQYASTSQSTLASRAGLDTVLATLRNTASFASFPCSQSGTLSVPGATSTYSVTVQYANSSGSITCSGSGSTLGGATAPTQATVTSIGRAKGGVGVTMEENLQIATAPALSQALGYAIFTSNNASFTNGDTIDKASGGPSPDVYAGATVTCANGVISQGNLITYQPIDMTGNCTLDGGLTDAGGVTMGNSASVGGNVISYGGGITMTGNPTISGNATETNGNISLANSSTIGGNAAASGTITKSGGSTISGTTTQNDSLLSGQTMPTAISFPAVDTNTADWASNGWTVISVPSTSCSTFFVNNSSGAADTFMTDLYTATSKTFVYAPTCNVTYSRAHSFYINNDVALDVATLTLSNSNTFCAEVSAGSQTCSTSTSRLHNLSIFTSPTSACSTSSVTFTASNSTSFESNLSTFVYTPGEVSYANAPSMNGQVLACGGFTGSNAFTLTFDPSAADEDVWVGVTQSTTVTVLDKYLVSG